AGAFLTVDPLDASAKAEDPLSWNRYAYVRGNPLNRVDPTGEDDTVKQADTHGAPPDAGNKESPEERERRAKLEKLRAEQRAQLPAMQIPKFAETVGCSQAQKDALQAAEQGAVDSVAAEVGKGEARKLASLFGTLKFYCLQEQEAAATAQMAGLPYFFALAMNPQGVFTG
ncbi:MAG: hypothetical protein ABFD84_13565, partial [Candidatus Polarisedimenticolia bacterium]